ncbi:MAG: hypothetical protein NTY95_17210 [Bacteroidia bacterium]|jgi:hypothetical protein|nr:hypothetical protein [Bacteroidia bacterium]
MLLTVPLITIPIFKAFYTDLQYVMFFGGVILFFYALLSLFKKVIYYAILITACAAIFTINWFVKGSLGEDIAMSVGFICIAGYIAGIIGLLIYARSWNRLPNAGAALSLLVIPILLISISAPPYRKLVTPVSEGILIGIQLFITILLLSIGFINRGESWLSKALLIIVSIILILLGLWVLIANKFTARIYAIDEIIVAFIAFYAYLKIPKPDKV